MMNYSLASNRNHHKHLSKAAYRKDYYSYAHTQLRSGNKGLPVIASPIRLPLETDGPATCLVYFYHS